MNCPECDSKNVTVAILMDGFSTWFCHECIASGSYASGKMPGGLDFSKHDPELDRNFVMQYKRKCPQS